MSILTRALANIRGETVKAPNADRPQYSRSGLFGTGLGGGGQVGQTAQLGCYAAVGTGPAATHFKYEARLCNKGR